MSTRRLVFNLIVALTLILGLVPLALPARVARAVSTDVVISQVYGGGGNCGATKMISSSYTTLEQPR